MWARVRIRPLLACLSNNTCNTCSHCRLSHLGWKYYPELFKAMLMTAFPPIDELDNIMGTAVFSKDLAKTEKLQVNFLRVMDMHLASAVTRDPKNNVFYKAALGDQLG